MRFSLSYLNVRRALKLKVFYENITFFELFFIILEIIESNLIQIWKYLNLGVKNEQLL